MALITSSLFNIHQRTWSILNSSKLSMSLFYKPGELPYDHNDGPEVEAAKAAWWRKG